MRLIIYAKNVKSILHIFGGGEGLRASNIVAPGRYWWLRQHRTDVQQRRKKTQSIIA